MPNVAVDGFDGRRRVDLDERGLLHFAPHAGVADYPACATLDPTRLAEYRRDGDFAAPRAAERGGRMNAGDARKLTRRTMLSGAGAVAGGVAMAAGGSTVLASAVTADAGGSGGLATGPTGTTVVEFRSRIAQSGTTGEHFESYGYLSSVAGARPADLFAPTTPSEATALFTAYSTGTLTMRTFDTDVHVLNVVGDLTVYRREAPGASWKEPGSFKVGAAVARFALTLQDVLTVFLAGQGLPTLTGDMVQTGARKVPDSGGRVFGLAGQRLRFFATGRGTLLDPLTSNSMLEIGGNWSAE